ncbi:MAG: 50S ribosomal protein L9 [Deltaproteobacteria bacterium]|nr:50S ribosomal protein L9 [Deltaproteobacteria bacterium]
MATNVQIILARDVPNLGRIGDLVSVRPGYARNYLVPQGLAFPASKKRVTQFEHQKRVIEHQRRTLRSASEARAQEISKVQLTLSAKVGEQNKLFGSVTNRDISAALAEEGIKVHHKDIKLDAPLKTLGLHTINLRLEADVTAQVKLVVAAIVEEVEEEEEEEEEEVDDTEDQDVDDRDDRDRDEDGNEDGDIIPGSGKTEAEEA